MVDTRPVGLSGLEVTNAWYIPAFGDFPYVELYGAAFDNVDPLFYESHGDSNTPAVIINTISEVYTKGPDDALLEFIVTASPPGPGPTNPVPEPGSMALFGMGIVMLGSVGYRRRRKQRS